MQHAGRLSKKPGRQSLIAWKGFPGMFCLYSFSNPIWFHYVFEKKIPTWSYLLNAPCKIKSIKASECSWEFSLFKHVDSNSPTSLSSSLSKYMTLAAPLRVTDATQQTLALAKRRDAAGGKRMPQMFTIRSKTK